LKPPRIWSFCYAKNRNVPTAKAAPVGEGDVWTWTALDADSKLIVSWMIGGRDAQTANIFMDDLQMRLATRVQLTTDGHKAYLDAVAGAFGEGVDYAMLVKLYGEAPPDTERKYSPSECLGTRRQRITGTPDPKHVSTSYTERHNLTMRMSMKRFARLSNAFSKKIDNHCHALALYFVWYNWTRIHKATRLTPAMAAGLTDRLMDMMDVAEMIDAASALWGAAQTLRKGRATDGRA
jgi:IS1 family transposase